jgi:hypothetical protein
LLAATSAVAQEAEPPAEAKPADEIVVEILRMTAPPGRHDHFRTKRMLSK